MFIHLWLRHPLRHAGNDESDILNYKKARSDKTVAGGANAIKWHTNDVGLLDLNGISFKFAFIWLVQAVSVLCGR